MSRLLVSLLLILACTTVSAREAGKHSANGGGSSCPDVATTAQTDPDVSASAKPAARVAAPTGRAAKPVSQRSGNAAGNQPNTPRWHSFLPGMFR